MDTRMKKKIKAKNALGPLLHRGVAFDEKRPKNKQWLVTAEYISGYVSSVNFRAKP
jgi:hypothetical protein